MKKWLCTVLVLASYLFSPSLVYGAMAAWPQADAAAASYSAFDTLYRADENGEGVGPFVDGQAAAGNVLASYFQIRALWKKYNVSGDLPKSTEFNKQVVRFLMLLAHDAITTAVVSKGKYASVLGPNGAYNLFRRVAERRTRGVFIANMVLGVGADEPVELTPIIEEVVAELKESKREVAVPVCWTNRIRWWAPNTPGSYGYVIDKIPDELASEFGGYTVAIDATRAVVFDYIAKVFSAYPNLIALLNSDTVTSLAVPLCDCSTVDDMRAVVEGLDMSDLTAAFAKMKVASDDGGDSSKESGGEEDSDGDEDLSTVRKDKGLPRRASFGTRADLEGVSVIDKALLAKQKAGAHAGAVTVAVAQPQQKRRGSFGSRADLRGLPVSADTLSGDVVHSGGGGGHGSGSTEEEVVAIVVPSTALAVAAQVAVPVLTVVDSGQPKETGEEAGADVSDALEDADGAAGTVSDEFTDEESSGDESGSDDDGDMSDHGKESGGEEEAGALTTDEMLSVLTGNMLVAPGSATSSPLAVALGSPPKRGGLMSLFSGFRTRRRKSKKGGRGKGKPMAPKHSPMALRGGHGNGGKKGE